MILLKTALSTNQKSMLKNLKLMTSNTGGELEASVLSEYKERLVRRRREVRELQEQRDRLLATQRKLQHLQQTIADNVCTQYTLLLQ